MAKKIKFNKINGNDTIANSIKTLNQNFELLEDTLETQISKGVSSLQVDDVEWNTSGTNGPTSQIKLSNGAIAKIKPIPSADESQSGVVTIGEQTIAGVTIGPALGKAICKALGIEHGILYNFLNSRAFLTAVCGYVGLKY